MTVRPRQAGTTQMGDPPAGIGEAYRENLPRRDPPPWTVPMLATLTHIVFSDPDWVFERKLDGERCLAFCRNGRAELFSRNRHALNAAYPEIAAALVRVLSGRGGIFDGEIVAFSRGVTSFPRLQKRMHHKSVAVGASGRAVRVFYYLFDLPYLDGFDLTGLPLRERKKALKAALTFKDPLRFTPHRNRHGARVHRKACRKGWEGVIAKRADSPYRHGRSRLWLKFKCVRRQEFVVGGFTRPRGERIGFGALLIGYYDGKRLRYAGKVGTGYDNETLVRLRRRFDAISRRASPFDEPVDADGAHWVAPRMVVEVGFTEWTPGGRLRHPRFIGLRRDKPPAEVGRESGKRVS